MRCPCYTDNSEEPDYYGECGFEIFQYGQNEHKFKDGKITEEEYLAEKARLAIVEPYLDDYLTRRACNLNLLMQSLNLVGAEIDEFVILQDDSNPCGYTAMDQAKVRALITESNSSHDLSQRILLTFNELLPFSTSTINGFSNFEDNVVFPIDSGPYITHFTGVRLTPSVILSI